MKATLKPHQRKAVEELANGKILYGGTGVGKGITALAYYYEKVCGGDLADIPSMKTPRDLYIITTAKNRDDLHWQKDAVKLGLGFHDDSLDGVNVVIDSWNNISKYIGVKDAFFIFDEQRSVGSGTWSKGIVKIAKANNWIMLSATPGDTWLDYITVFVANGFYKNRTEFKRRHVVYNTYSKFPKVDRYIETGTLIKNRRKLLVHMPYERHTVRHCQDVLVEYDKDLFKKVKDQRWHVYENRPLRDVAELFSVMRKVVNSDPSRLESVRKLLKTHPKLIVFYNFDYELEILRTLVSTPNAVESSSGILPQSSDKKAATPGEQQTLPCPESTQKLESVDSSGVDVSGAQNAATQSLITPWDPTGTESTSAPKKLPKDQSSLVGTIWETEWDEKKAFEQATRKSTSEKNSSPSLSSSETGTVASRHINGMGQILSPSSLVRSVSAEDATPSEHSLQTGVGSSFQVAEYNGHRHDPVPETDSWVYLVQYQAGAEGWNCVATDSVTFWSKTYSWRQHHQAHGRIDRLNTPYTHLTYYHLTSDSWIDFVIGEALGAKRNFNEASMGVKPF